MVTQRLKRVLVVQVSWLQKSRRIALGVATRAAMGNLVSDEEIDELLILFRDIGVTGALVRSCLPLCLPSCLPSLSQPMCYAPSLVKQMTCTVDIPHIYICVCVYMSVFIYQRAAVTACVYTGAVCGLLQHACAHALPACSSNASLSNVRTYVWCRM